MEIDDKLYKEDFDMYYNKDSIYIINFNKIKDIFVSYGVLNYVQNKIFR